MVSPSKTSSIEQPGRQRFGLLLPVASAGLLLVVGIVLWALASVNPMVGNLRGIGDDRPRLELLRNARFEDLQARVALGNVVSGIDRERSGLDMEHFLEHARLAAAALRALQTAGFGDGEELLAAVIEAHASLERARAEVIAEWRSGGSTSHALGPLMRSMEQAEDNYVATADRLRIFGKARVDRFIAFTGTAAIRARGLVAIAGAVGGVTLLILGAALYGELKRRDADIARLREQRSALVREVHHRIKNHLQGLLGLLEDYGKTHTVHREAMTTLQGHVLALVSIHGLQATQQNETVILAELLRNQVRLIQAGFPGVQVRLAVDDRAGACTLSGERAVMIALSVAELIVNAHKHGTTDPIEVALTMDDDRARVTITNQVAGTPALNWKSETGFGTGLSLVSSLTRDIGPITQEVRGSELTMALSLPMVSA